MDNIDDFCETLDRRTAKKVRRLVDDLRLAQELYDILRQDGYSMEMIQLVVLMGEN